VKLPYYGMVNLVAGRKVVPELIQDGFTPESVEHEVRMLLDDGEARRCMREALAEVRGRLAGEQVLASVSETARGTAARRAAAVILRVAESALRKRE
jgi:lipid-A-disaccharide synthase